MKIGELGNKKYLTLVHNHQFLIKLDKKDGVTIVTVTNDAQTNVPLTTEFEVSTAPDIYVNLCLFLCISSLFFEALDWLNYSLLAVSGIQLIQVGVLSQQCRSFAGQCHTHVLAEQCHTHEFLI